MSDLIERLRSAYRLSAGLNLPLVKEACNDAIDELKRLTKENERLQRENEALAQKVAELEEKVAVLTHLNEQIDKKINFTKDLERENEEHIRQINLRNDTIDDLRAELAALKAQSTEPVAWQSMGSAPKDGTEFVIRYPLQGNVKALCRWDLVHKCWKNKSEVIFPESQKCEWHQIEFTPPTSTALVEDFKRRAVEVCKQHEIGFDGTARAIEEEIESLPLIGEK